MNLPSEFIARMQTTLGIEGFTAFEKALEEEVPVSLRIHRKKLNLTPELEPIPWCQDGYYLKNRPLFASDPLWHAGAYYVQEASSMLIEQAFIAAKARLKGPLKILDLCAAPGGKSTHIASLCNAEDVLVSNEVIRSRVSVLTENLKKQGYSNTIITSADSADFEKLGEVFDLILVDAPCSGEGLFRRDPEAIKHWTAENIQTCELRQKRILDAVISCLKPGGFLIYSTCTYNSGENEKQVEALLQKGFELASFDVLGKSVNHFQAYPHLFKGEGFFISLLRKTETTNAVESTSKKSSLTTLKTDPQLTEWMPSSHVFRGFNNSILASTEETFAFFDAHVSLLQCSSLGTEIGSLKNNLFSPSETLPFAVDLNTESFVQKELTQEQAIHYLSKNALHVDDRRSGYVLLRYRNCTIGLGKYAGNRINNLYPSGWRLRSIPSQGRWFSLS